MSNDSLFSECYDLDYFSLSTENGELFSQHSVDVRYRSHYNNEVKEKKQLEECRSSSTIV